MPSPANASNHVKKWNIAYYEGGPFIDYTDCMRAIIKSLMHSGWINETELPDIKGDVKEPFWNWLCSNSKSSKINFAPENAFSAGWSEENRKKLKEKIITRLNEGDIDLIIAMGTWAGQDLANNRHHVPTLVLSTSNPIEAGIIISAEDSGFDHVTARYDSNRYFRQIRMFHRAFPFKKLGVVYENTPDGRLYSAMNELEQVAKERHFELVPCYFTDTTEDREAAGRECLQCFEQISDQVDAVYLTAMLAISEKITSIAELLKKKGIPSFSMNGSKYVQQGILMSISTDEGYRIQGQYDAQKLIDILQGAKPRDLDQSLPDVLDLAINMDTAKSINFQIPTGLLKISKKYYDNSSQ